MIQHFYVSYVLGVLVFSLNKKVYKEVWFAANYDDYQLTN